MHSAFDLLTTALCAFLLFFAFLLCAFLLFFAFLLCAFSLFFAFLLCAFSLLTLIESKIDLFQLSFVPFLSQHFFYFVLFSYHSVLKFTGHV